MDERTVGHVYVFGSGDCCQLGLGEDILSRKRPTKIDFFDDKEIIDIAAGGLHNLALSRSGAVYSWGCNDEKALGHEQPEWSIGRVEGLQHEHISHIACGDSISAALTKEGRVYAWGTFRDSKGVLGFDSNSQLQVTPVLIKALSQWRIVSIAAGANHLLALSDKGQIFAWGSGEQGQLGRKIMERRKTPASLEPRNITPRTRLTISGIACGSYHSMAWSDNVIFTWGLNNYGQLGHHDKQDRILPDRIDPLSSSRILMLRGGEHHTVTLASDGQVWTWGRGDSGQLCQGSIVEYSDHPIPTKFSSIKLVASGGNHCLAVDHKNQLYSWGFGGMYQLGNGKEEDELSPFLIEANVGKILAVQAGGQHSMLLCHPKPSQ